MGLKEFVEKKKALQEEMKKTGKDSLMSELKEFFQNNPEVVAIHWKQYTPYFNDGDPCVFGVDDVTMKLKDAKGDEGDYEDGFISPWSLKEEKGSKYVYPDDKKKLGEALEELNKTFHEIEDILKIIFEDHVKVTISKDLKVEVEEYDHD